MGIPILLITLLLFLTLLFTAEAVFLSRRTKKIRLRICVSGTRGKSGTTRDIASVLRKSGLTVLAKTTGSGAMYIMPDGSEEPVPRRGIVSILEQKQTIAKAASLGVDCLVTEIMSIHPDNHKIESQRIIKPHILVLTNFRADHLDVSGGSVTETESVYLNDVFAGTRAFVHRNHISPHLEAGIKEAGGLLVPVEPGVSDRLKLNSDVTRFRIRENIDLVSAVASHLEVPDTYIREGIESARHDTGRTELYTLCKGEKTIWFANTFAANDPESTAIMMNQIVTESGIQPSAIAGILSLRSDRAERTRQWIDYINSDEGGSFSYLFVAGRQRSIVKRAVPSSIILKEKSPERITELIADMCPDKTIVFGLANIAGLGNDLVNYLRDQDKGYGISDGRFPISDF